MGHATLLDGNADAQHCAGHVKTAAYTTLQADHLKVRVTPGGRQLFQRFYTNESTGIRSTRCTYNPIYLQSDLRTSDLLDLLTHFLFIRSNIWVNWKNRSDDHYFNWEHNCHRSVDLIV